MSNRFREDLDVIENLIITLYKVKLIPKSWVVEIDDMGGPTWWMVNAFWHTEGLYARQWLER